MRSILLQVVFLVVTVTLYNTIKVRGCHASIGLQVIAGEGGE
jgi:hypothetical protein